MAKAFVPVPSVYPKLLELRQSKTAAFKPNKYLKPTTVLRYYQVVGALHMMLLERMVLGDGTGLGKTLETIAAYSFLLEQNPQLRLLIVCPKSALYQWVDEFEKFSIGISVRALTNEYNGFSGAQARRIQYEAFKENVMVVGYSTILEEYEMIKRALGAEYMVVFDEAVAFKNRKTKTHGAAAIIAESAQRVYGLSATIIKNGLEEVYGIYAIIVPGLFGTITRFKDTYCQQKLMRIPIGGKIRYIPQITGYKNLKQFKEALSPYFLIRRKEEVASELPKLISRKVILEMEDEQRTLYREALAGITYEERIKQEFYEIVDKIRVAGGTADEKTMKLYEERKTKYEQFLSPEGKKRGKLAALTYCQMISNGPALLNRPGESSKDLEFDRLLKEELLTEKIIVFTRFTSGIPSLEVICERNKIPYTKITGELSELERRQAQARFMNDIDCRIIIITTAGSAALNLQAAGVVLFIDTPWSYGDLVQTIGRAQRIGSLQEHVLLIHLVNKATIDIRVMNRVGGKKDLSDEILGDTAEGALDFTRSDQNVVDDLFSDIMKDAEELSK